MMLKPKTLAMILAGGRVDELNVLTYYRPKSAVPFGGFARVIDFPLSNLMQSGLELVAILSQYRSFSLINHVGIGRAWDMIGRYRGIFILPPYIGYGHSHWYRGSADAVFQNLDFINYHNPDNLLILSGDHVYRMDYQEVLEYHQQKDADLTIGVLRVPMSEAHRFGVAEIDDEDNEIGGRVLRYSEKPAEPQSNWASLTVYCFKTQVLYEALEANQRADNSFEFGMDIIPWMMQNKKRVYGFKFSGYWGYTRTIDEYWQTSMDLLGPQPRIPLDQWGVRTNLEHRSIRDFQPLQVGDSADINDSLIYNGCRIDGHVERSILFPGVTVAKNAVVRDSVLFFNNEVQTDARLNKVVSDVNTVFGRQVMVGHDPEEGGGKVSVIGWKNRIPTATRIGSGCTIYPQLESATMPTTLTDGEVLR